jgi:acyl-CoA hydrolase
MENVIHVGEVDHIVEADHDLVGVPEIPLTETEKRIGAFIAERIPDGACIQLGVGGIPNAVAYSLKDKKDLGVHTEALSDAVADLSALGVVNGSRKTIYRDKIVVGRPDHWHAKASRFRRQQPLPGLYAHYLCE